MTNQEIFDIVSTHLIKQGVQSVTSDGDGFVCAYRGENGTMCAVGCLIKDHLYTPGFEGYGARATHVLSAVEESIGHTLSVDQKQMINALQGVHDSEYTYSGFTKQLMQFANKYGDMYDIKFTQKEATEC